MKTATLNVREQKRWLVLNRSGRMDAVPETEDPATFPQRDYSFLRLSGLLICCGRIRFRKFHLSLKNRSGFQECEVESKLLGIGPQQS